MTVSAEELDGLSEAQAKIVTFADILAVNEGGPTPDILRSGRVEVYPGAILTAEVIDMEFVPERVPKLLYGLEVRADDDYTETITVDVGFKHTTLAVDEGEPHGAQSAPDYAIESFLDRFYVGKIIEEATRKVA